MLVTIGVTAIVVLALCSVAHEWDMKNYKEEVKNLIEERNRYIDKYFALLEEIKQDKKDQVDNTPADYIMD
jgi:hypothetical protein